MKLLMHYSGSKEKIRQNHHSKRQLGKCAKCSIRCLSLKSSASWEPTLLFALTAICALMAMKAFILASLGLTKEQDTCRMKVLKQRWARQRGTEHGPLKNLLVTKGARPSSRATFDKAMRKCLKLRSRLRRQIESNMPGARWTVK